MPRTDRALLTTLSLTALAPMSWGSTYAVTTQFLPDGRPLFTGLMRALPAGVVLVAATRVRPQGVWWWRTTVLGALYIGIFMPLLFVSAYRLPGGVASTLGSIGPLVTLGLAAALLSERPTVRKAVAGFAGIVGVALVVLRADARIDTLGVVAGLTGTISMATANVLTKRWGRPAGVGGLTFVGWQLAAGGLMIAPVAFLVEGAPPSLDTRNIVGYLYLALVNTVLAYSLWFRGLAKLPANSVAFLGLTGPITAATIGWVALDQPLSPLQLLGMVVAFTGTLLGALQIAQRSADSVQQGREPSQGLANPGGYVLPATGAAVRASTLRATTDAPTVQSAYGPSGRAWTSVRPDRGAHDEHGRCREERLANRRRGMGEARSRLRDAQRAGELS